ncbi:GNAT family N-acetyltransferase [Actinoplanes sp. NPDC026619]|uniref:GNAT family N-acetyltransferase n=1 Tax=Actinoplanes sp. NPDC026619 TaxID=3155798 RepID=UPI0033E8616C
MEFRQISAAERTATMFPLQTYAFSPSPWSPADEEAYRGRMRFFETTVNLIAEESGQTLAGVAALRMRENVRGLVHDMAGVASVSTHPSARRRGLVRELMQRLLRQMREEGCAVSALYPFRPSFYAKFGFVGIPRHRIATFAPEGLAHLVRAELPGEVERLPMSEAFEDYDEVIQHQLARRHGFAVFDEVRAAELRDMKSWVAVARSGGEVVGAVRYVIEAHGGDLVAQDLHCTGPLGRALLLQFFARHVDQVARVSVRLSTDDVPELWGVDFEVTVEGRVDNPTDNAPMVRVLDMEALSGSQAGPGEVTVEIAGDELIGGVWQLSSSGGVLGVEKGGTPSATLSAAGFSALLYGVLDPVEVFTRGLGEFSPEAIPTLTEMFPRQMPYLFADF